MVLFLLYRSDLNQQSRDNIFCRKKSFIPAEWTIVWHFDSWNLPNSNAFDLSIDQFRYIKIQSQTIDLRGRLWGINPTNSVFIPQSLVLRSIVWDWILIYRNWSIVNFYSNFLSVDPWISSTSFVLIDFRWSGRVKFVISGIQKKRWQLSSDLTAFEEMSCFEIVRSNWTTWLQ